MKNILRLVLILGLVCVAQNGYSEDELDRLFPSEETPQEITGATSFNSFMQMKNRIAGLVEENKKLRAQHALLAQEKTTLQTQINGAEQDLRALGIDLEKIQAKHKQISDVSKKGNEVLAFQNEILMRESKIAFLKRKSLDLDEEMRAMQNELDNFDKEQAILEEQARKVEEQSAQILQHQSEEIEQFKTKHKALELQSKLNEDRMAELQKLSLEHSSKIQELTESNKDLHLQAIQLKSDIDIKRKEVDILRDKNILSMRSTQIDQQPKQDEKAELLENVNALEAEYRNLEQAINTTLDWQTSKKQLLDKIISIDQENQGLREKISAAQNQIDETK